MNFGHKDRTQARHDTIFAAIAASPRPLSLRDLVERFRSRMPPAQVASSIRCLYTAGRIEPATQRHGGHTGNTYRAVTEPLDTAIHYA